MKNNMTFPKRKVMKKWVRFTVLAIIITFFVSSVDIIFNSFNKTVIDKDMILYFYNIDQNLDYKVNLYDNTYIESDYLGMNETYIADLVSSIDLSFNYKFGGSKIVPVKYTYDIKAEINGRYTMENEESKVWTKEYVLKEKTVKSSDSQTNSEINEPVNIDYSFYNDVVSQFRKELKMPIDASLKVVFNITAETSISDQGVKDSKSIVVNIPLNQQAFKITDEYEKDYSNYVYPEVEEVDPVNVRKLISGVCLCVTSILMLVLLFREIFNIPKKNYYTNTLNKILKEYGDIVVEVINPVNEEEMDIIEVKSFDEMIDLEEELRIPIMFYEEIEYLKGEFTLVHNNLLYKFVLRNEDGLTK